MHQVRMGRRRGVAAVAVTLVALAGCSDGTTGAASAAATPPAERTTADPVAPSSDLGDSLPTDAAAGTAMPAPDVVAPSPSRPPSPSPSPTPTPTPSPGPVQVFGEVPALHPSVDGYAAGFVDVVAPNGTTHRVAVRLARTSEERAHGLMEVEHLPEGAGMWFVYEEDRTGPFWMKDTRVPLDIAFVGADDRIVNVADAVPCESDPCPTYPAEGTYHNVLEVPNGWLASIGVGPGDVVRLVTP